MLSQITFVLCHPTHPGNIGAVARAMKNMGLTALTLVQPHAFPHPEATARAAGASDLLENAHVVATLEEALKDCCWCFGTSARERTFSVPLLTAENAAQKMVQLITQGPSQKVAVIFGTEQSGLTNAQLQLCDYQVIIPTASVYSSLNLAAAVQVLSYEIYLKSQASFSAPLVKNKATFEETHALFKHFAQVASALGFVDEQKPKKLWPRMQRLLAKAQLEKEEVAILQGFLKKIPLPSSSSSEGS